MSLVFNLGPTIIVQFVAYNKRAGVYSQKRQLNGNEDRLFINARSGPKMDVCMHVILERLPISSTLISQARLVSIRPTVTVN